MNNAVEPLDYENVEKLNQEQFCLKEINGLQQVIPNFGIHPRYIKEEYFNNIGKWEQQLIQFLEKYPNAQIGECGLDFQVKDTIPKKWQTTIFQKQIDIAIKYQRILSVHSYRATGDVLKAFKKTFKQLENEERRVNIILHSFGGNEEMTNAFLRLDNKRFFFSVSLLCIKRPDIIQNIPLQNLLIETDSPYQNYDEYIEEQLKENTKQTKNNSDFQIISGKIRNNQEENQTVKFNKPHYLQYYLPILAQIYKQDENSIAQEIVNNFYRCLKN